MAEPYCSAGLGPAHAVGGTHFREEMAFAVVFHQVKLLRFSLRENIKISTITHPTHPLYLQGMYDSVSPSLPVYHVTFT